MRGGKSFLILVVLALGLGAYIYFVEIEARAGRMRRRRKPDVFTVDTDKIEEVEIAHPRPASVTTLKKNGALWQIVAPETLDADEAEISVGPLDAEVARSAADARGEARRRWPRYGLEPPRLTVGFRVGRRDRRCIACRSATRRRPAATCTPGSRASRSSSSISAYLEDSLNKTTFALRDKSVLKFAREDVDSLTLEPLVWRRHRLREEGRRLAVHQAARRQGRLQRAPTASSAGCHKRE